MIKIRLLLDACGIGYTEGQLLKLEKLVEKCIEQHIYKAVKEITSKKSFAKTPVQSMSIASQIDETTTTFVKNEPMVFSEVEVTTSTKSEPYVLGDTLSNSGDTFPISGDDLSNSGDALPNCGDTLSNIREESFKRVVDDECEESWDSEDIINEPVTNNSFYSKLEAIKFQKVGFLFQCTECTHYSAHKKENLYNHMEKNHKDYLVTLLKKTNSKELKCIQCAYSCDSNEDLDIHLLKNHSDGFIFLKMLKEPVKQKFVCSECELAFTTKILFDLHNDIKHTKCELSVYEKTKKKWQCPFCPVKKAEDRIFSHVQSCEFLQASKSCPECGKTYTGPTAHLFLRRHMESHEQVQCKVCQKMLLNKQILMEHMEEKHERKPCGICEDLIHPDELEEHINEKHFCIPCDKNLRIFEGISEHLKKQANEEMICRLVSVRLWSFLFGGSKLDFFYTSNLFVTSKKRIHEFEVLQYVFESL